MPISRQALRTLPVTLISLARRTARRRLNGNISGWHTRGAEVRAGAADTALRARSDSWAAASPPPRWIILETLRQAFLKSAGLRVGVRIPTVFTQSTGWAGSN